MSQPIMVSISCIAYNQEKYIRETLEGFVKQKTNFPFEVLIHDDASTDGTADIIREYAEKYPEIIKPILQTENQHSKKIKIQATYNYPRAVGKYVAFCEGDDYWCDDSKLQRQFDALEQNKECAVSVHNIRHINRDGEKLDGHFPAVKMKEGKISARQYITNELVESPWLFQTSSFFIRRDIINDFQQYAHVYPCGDLPLMLFALQYGDCWYIDREMSCYRKDSGGAMSKLKDSEQANIRYYKRMIQGHKQFNDFSGGKYKEQFEHAIRFSEVQILKSSGKFRSLMKKRYQNVRKHLNNKNKALILLGCVSEKLAYKVYLWQKKKNRSK